ncbi:sensor histidine kinase [Exilibacterium tricleocarpae]|uniref:histidine kinase n=1 Tax=Exilibacterium tricleocarpae TaxID=2591008 RepID=A0A545TQF0_9GAMM|nr:sensor histidine kinase [Exilibacterium tricleocarpae]TQV79440.1 sensor histidine kinase [Exilibacterium tricleocarpae]
MEFKRQQLSIDAIFYMCFGSTLIGISIGSLLNQKVIVVLAPLAVATVVTLFIYRFPLHSKTQLLRDKHILTQDLTHHKEQSIRYKHFAEAIIKGQEQEKKRLAQELHDDTIQRLIIIGQSVQLVSMDLNIDGENEELTNIENLVNESIQSIRSFIKQLRPTYLEKLGLVSALRELVVQSDKNSDAGIQILFESSGEPLRLDNQVELALYRIAQSSVSNAIRHSGGDRIELKIDFMAETVDLSVNDNGKGFDVPDDISLLHNTSFGLMGMQERADFIGAEFSVHTSATRGTKILIRVPTKENLDKKKSPKREDKPSVYHLGGSRE